ncbi:hypothetical protein GCM10010413_30280 [Promicromonospora sukumoe]|uniref:Uncharacterized protein n=1 Tax=Promicromonospora sukumoe TaxID=88382 RepID=A0A7W3PDB2_9MICO|nr:hypothetical protein [Promicromonospora sukumoe]MBA8807780.1 hypothetical protein [Promicromonospora sukumoe]
MQIDGIVTFRRSFIGVERMTRDLLIDITGNSSDAEERFHLPRHREALPRAESTLRAEADVLDASTPVDE